MTWQAKRQEAAEKYCSSDAKWRPTSGKMIREAHLAGSEWTVGQLASVVEALESIASPRNPKHELESFWLTVDHSECATTLANDTKIAREALTLLREMRALPRADPDGDEKLWSGPWDEAVTPEIPGE